MSRLLKSGLLAVVVACVAAAVGTAIAATGNGGKAKPKPKAHAATTKRLVDREIRKLAPKLHVAFARNSQNAGRSASSVAVDSLHKTGIVTANAGQNVDLVTIGPFRFTLVCRALTGTAVSGEIDLISSEDHVAIESTSTGPAADFAAGRAYPLGDIMTSPNPQSPGFDGDGGFFTALAPSGTVVSGDAYVGVRIAGHDCAGGLFAQS